MKLPFTFSFILIVGVCFGQFGWTTTSAPYSPRYDDVYFINDSIGWAVCFDPGRIYKTTDQGNTWVEQFVCNYYMRSCEFFDSTTGFAGTVDATLYKTTNSGKSWTDIMDSIKNPALPGICGLAIPDSTTVYGCGVWITPAYVIKSTDRGDHWQVIDMSAYASSLIDIQFLNADTGFVTGSSIVPAEGGIILYTTDGGVTWTPKLKTMVSLDRVWKIQTLDSIHFYASIEADDEMGPTRILKSNDGGMTWSTIVLSGSYHYLQMVGFMDTLTGWTGGNGELFATKDGGITWDSLMTGSEYDRFFRVNSKIAFLTGSGIYKYNADSITTGISGTSSYEAVHQLRVSPNPTSGLVNISITLATHTFADLNIYSSNGQLVQPLMRQRKEAGQYSFTAKLEATVSQTYFVLLHTNEGVISRKVEMMK